MVAILADLHIKPRTWSNWPDIKHDAYVALDEIRTRLRSKPCKSMILAGDILDSNNPCPEDLLALMSFCSGPSPERIYYINGNHDNIQPSFMALIPNTTRLSSEPVELEGGWFFGVPYLTYGNQIVEALQKIKDNIKRDNLDESKCYIVMHESFKHLLSLSDCYKFSIEELLGIFSPEIHVIVGDIHVNDRTCFKEGSGWVYSPGPLYPQDWEQAKHPCYLSFLNPRTGVIGLEEVLVRHYVDLPVLDKGQAIFDDLRAILAGFDDNLELKTAVRLKVPDGVILPVIPDDLLDKCYITTLNALVVDQVQDNSTTTETYTMDSAVAAVIQAFVPEELQPSVQELYSEISSSTDPKAAVNSWIHERKAIMA